MAQFAKSIFVVRHGQTTSQIDRDSGVLDASYDLVLTNPNKDSSLTHFGRTQVEQLNLDAIKHSLIKNSVIILSATTLRCQETAEIITENLQKSGVTVSIFHTIELNEPRSIAFHGVAFTFDKVDRLKNLAIAFGEKQLDFSQIETQIAFCDRTRATLFSYLDKPEFSDCVIIFVTHHYNCRVMLNIADGDCELMAERAIANGSMHELEFKNFAKSV